MENDKLQLFEDKAIRTAWDAEEEEWYFSVVDVVGVLTDSPNPNNYWKVLKKRLKDEGNQSVTSCNQLKLKSPKDGKRYLTDVWRDRGVKKGVEYAILTDEITRTWSGMTTRQYKRLKGLKKENLRDNMTTTEIILNMLAETSTTDISKATKPETLAENIEVARRGGNVAGIAKQALEAETGTPVITSQNAAQLNAVVTGMIEGVINAEDEKDEKEKT